MHYNNLDENPDCNDNAPQPPHSKDHPGLTTASNGDKLLEELTILKEYNASVVTLSKNNLNWKMPGVYEQVKKKLNK
eukprot:13487503-Ditylum_brightwellii.AAC.2